LTDWPFNDAANTAVLSTKKVIEGGDWIQSVYRDSDDGMWQSHGVQDGGPGEEDARVVSLGLIFKKDPSLASLCDLPLGWCAWRGEPGENWVRGPIDNSE